MNTPEAIIAQFPTRPLHISKAMIVKNPTKSLIVGILICLSALLIPYLGFPGLLNDYEISKNPVEVDAGIKGECRSKMFVTNCDVTLTYQGEKVERDFSFFDIKGGDYYVTAITSKDKPTLLSVDLAVDKIINRLIIQLIFFALIIAVGVVCLRGWVRGKKMNEVLAQINDKKLIPILVPVKIQSTQAVVAVTYQWPTPQGAQICYAAFHEKKEGGMLRIPTDDTTQVYALGVSTDTQTTPILLDGHLSRIDLTTDERIQLFESINSLS